jgi:proline dehydrogenase
MGMFDKMLASALPALPRKAVHGVAQRYIAGETLAEAVECVRGLNELGAAATVDILGENTTGRAQAETTHAAYSSLLTALVEHDLDANVSVKLTALGLVEDPAYCLESVSALCEQGAASDTFIRIDMEDSSVTQATLDLYESLRKKHDNIGPVLQAYLRRTLDDARKLGKHAASVRLCKGIYVEDRELAWKGKDVVRKNYTRVLRELMSSGCYVGIATHDESLVWEALNLVDELQLAPEDYEFQMLLGVDEQMRRILIEGGHRMRVYVPYGEHWYEYSMRRLKENPEIAGHVARATLRGE